MLVTQYNYFNLILFTQNLAFENAPHELLDHALYAS